MSILETVAEYFTSEGWSFSRLDGQPVLQVKFQAGDLEWLCYAQAREDQGQLIFYSVSPANPPEELRPAMAEFLTRVNFGLFAGNFEMDYADGEVRCKTSIDVSGDRLTAPLIRGVVDPNLHLMRTYLPGIEKVIDGEESVEAILEGIRS